MKYYMLFLWGDYEAEGGMDDLFKDFSAVDDAAAIKQAFDLCFAEYGHWGDPSTETKHTHLICIEDHAWRSVPFDFPTMKKAFVSTGEGI